MIIGITGGIGCGKTTFSNILSKKLSAPILDADKIAREVLTDKEILLEICNFFGSSILTPTGDIDRKKFSDLVFSNASNIKRLNQITHPLIMEKIKNRAEKLSLNNKFIILDVPLPNSAFIELSDYIITVWANLTTRIDRVISRSNLTRADVVSRIKKQPPESKYTAIANFVILNNQTLDSLENQADIVIRNLVL